VAGSFGRCARLRDRAILALLAYGGLRRSEVVGLDVGDCLPEYDLRPVRGKDGYEGGSALPEGGGARGAHEGPSSAHRGT